MNVHSELNMIVLDAGLAVREERLRRTSLQVSDPHPRPMRRWIGRQLVRLGTRVAGEPTMRPARAR